MKKTRKIPEKSIKSLKNGKSEAFGDENAI